MRFAASPLLVAVAFGFLGPAALDAEEDDFEEIADVPATSPTAAPADAGSASETAPA